MVTPSTSLIIFLPLQNQSRTKWAILNSQKFQKRIWSFMHTELGILSSAIFQDLILTIIQKAYQLLLAVLSWAVTNTEHPMNWKQYAFKSKLHKVYNLSSNKEQQTAILISSQPYPLMSLKYQNQAIPCFSWIWGKNLTTLILMPEIFFLTSK